VPGIVKGSRNAFAQSDWLPVAGGSEERQGCLGVRHGIKWDIGVGTPPPLPLVAFFLEGGVFFQKVSGI